MAYYTSNGIKYGWMPNIYLILKEKDEPLVEDIQTYLLGNGRVKYYCLASNGVKFI